MYKEAAKDGSAGISRMFTCAWCELIFPVVDGEEAALQNDNRKKMRG
jgi:hypothetical protein